MNKNMPALKEKWSCFWKSVLNGEMKSKASRIPRMTAAAACSEKLHANTFWMGRGGSITHTISGIDIAMWDILGKVTGQPVGRIYLCGQRRSCQSASQKISAYHVKVLCDYAILPVSISANWRQFLRSAWTLLPVGHH